MRKSKKKNGDNNNFKVNFIGVGAPRSGTTWIASILEQHPEVCFSIRKELHYFNEYSPRGKKNNSRELGIDYYRSFWPKKIPKGKKIGEISPSYLFDKKAAENIKKTFPKAKVIINLREPVERTYSRYFLDKNRMNEEKSWKTFEEALEKESALKEGSLYYEQVKRYYDTFPKKQIKVILLDDIKNNAEKIIKNTYEFVGVNKSFKPKTPNQNTMLKPKSETIKKLLYNLMTKPEQKINAFIKKRPKLKKIGILIHKTRVLIYFHNLRVKIMEINMRKSKKPKMKQETKKILQKYYKKDIKKLEKLIDRNLSNWLK